MQQQEEKKPRGIKIARHRFRKPRSKIILQGFAPLTTVDFFPHTPIGPFPQNTKLFVLLFFLSSLLFGLPSTTQLPPELSFSSFSIPQSFLSPLVWLLFSCYGDRRMVGLKMATSFSPLSFGGSPGLGLSLTG